MIEWAEAQGPGRHSVARRLRAPGRGLVAAPRQCLVEAEFDARELQGSASYPGTPIRRHRGFFGSCTAQPRAAAAEMGFSELTNGGLLGHSVPGVTALRTYPRLPAASRSRSGFSANRGRARRRGRRRGGRTARPQRDGNSSIIHSSSCLTLPRCTVRRIGTPLHGQDSGCLKCPTRRGLPVNRSAFFSAKL